MRSSRAVTSSRPGSASMRSCREVDVLAAGELLAGGKRVDARVQRGELVGVREGVETGAELVADLGGLAVGRR